MADVAGWAATGRQSAVEIVLRLGKAMEDVVEVLMRQTIASTRSNIINTFTQSIAVRVVSCIEIASFFFVFFWD